MNLDRESDKLRKKFNEKNNNDNALFKFHEKWDAEEIATDKELQDIETYLKRAARFEEIWGEANNLRLARCEAKEKEVGKDEFMRLIHGWGGKSGKEFWSDGDEMTELEKEAVSLRIELKHQEWFWTYGKPYRMEDDPNAKF